MEQSTIALLQQVNWCFAGLICNMLISAFVILRSLFLPFTVDWSPVCSSLDAVFKVMSTLPLLGPSVLQKIPIQCMHAMSVIWSETQNLQSSKHDLLVLALKCLSPPGGLKQAYLLPRVMHRERPITYIGEERHTSQRDLYVSISYLVCWRVLTSSVQWGLWRNAGRRWPMRDSKWSLCFQKWSIVLGINGNLIIRLLPATADPVSTPDTPCLVAWLSVALKVMVWERIIFFFFFPLFALLSQLEMFETRRCFSRSYDPIR